MTETWEPANDTERGMANALAAGDQRGYFGILSGAELYLPQLLAASRNESSGQGFVTAILFGHTFLPVFTSMEAMLPHVVGVADSYTVTNYLELRRKWPVPAWRLAVNPGSPIDAYVSIEAVEAVAIGAESIPTAAEAILDAMAEEEANPPPEPPDDTEAILRAAAERGDSELYLQTLLDAVVIMPTARPVEDGSALFEAGFPWRAGGTPTDPTIEVFTSMQSLTQAYPGGVASVTVAMPFLLALWPPGHGLSVDPGTPLAMEVPEEQVHTLLLWSAPIEEQA